jgi:hypothetical protein
MRFFRTIRAILREIFEESAYERFCLRRGVPAGRASYTNFLRETKAGAKVKCC